jgi:hypothetical protein
LSSYSRRMIGVLIRSMLLTVDASRKVCMFSYNECMKMFMSRLDTHP